MMMPISIDPLQHLRQLRHQFRSNARLLLPRRRLPQRHQRLRWIFLVDRRQCPTNRHPARAISLIVTSIPLRLQQEVVETCWGICMARMVRVLVRRQLPIVTFWARRHPQHQEA